MSGGVNQKCIEAHLDNEEWRCFFAPVSTIVSPACSLVLCFCKHNYYNSVHSFVQCLHKYNPVPSSVGPLILYVILQSSSLSCFDRGATNFLPPTYMIVPSPSHVHSTNPVSSHMHPCMQYTYPYIKTPIFVLNSLYDTAQLSANQLGCLPPNCSQEQMEFFDNFRVVSQTMTAAYS